MAEICRFYGIIIAMFADDHNPPHIHIRYGDYDAIITIDHGIVKGTMPSKELKLVFTWMDSHKAELKANWERLQNGEEAVRIKPLRK